MSQMPRLVRPVLNSVATGAQRLGISSRKTWELVSEGRIKTVKIDGRTLIPEEEIMRIAREGVPPVEAVVA